MKVYVFIVGAERTGDTECIFFLGPNDGHISIPIVFFSFYFKEGFHSPISFPLSFDD
jgi:hypothetical protein